MPNKNCSGWKDICPKCGKPDAKYHLMMHECDECIGALKNALEQYIAVKGVLVPNPEFNMTKPRTYADWMEIAHRARLSMPPHKTFREGVERAAALAALNAPNNLDAQISAIELEFHRHSSVQVTPRESGSGHHPGIAWQPGHRGVL